MKRKLLHIACVVVSIVAAWLWYISGFIMIGFLLDSSRGNASGIIKGAIFFILVIIVSLTLFLLVKKVGDTVVNKYIPYYGVGMGILVVSFFVLAPFYKYILGLLFLIGIAIVLLFVMWFISGGFTKLKNNSWQGNERDS